MTKSKAVRDVATYSLLGNIFLLIIKLLVGFTSRSQAMIADGLNSAGDVFASVMTFVGNHISSQPEDHDHPYGHGKAEYIFSMIISFSLMFVAFTIFRSSLDALTKGETFLFSIWLVFVAITTIILKVLLYIHAHKVQITHNSLLAQANAYDHRNDIMLTSLTLVSIITGYFNIFIVDGIVGMLLSIWIAYSGIEIFVSSYNVLMDKTVPENIHEAFSKSVLSIEGVDHIDTITAKPLGSNFLLLVKVSVDANLSVYDSHEIACKVKASLMDYENVDDVIVHMNPTQFHP